MRTRVLGYLLLLWTSSLGFGCTITIGGGPTEFEDHDAAKPDEAPRLPEPTVWRVPSPELTSEQQQRKEEVDQILAEQYRDYRIAEATQGYSGDIIYWVDSDSIPGPFLDPPPPPSAQEGITLPPGVELARTELELYPELRGPAGTTPIHRPDFSAYVMGEASAVSLQDYIENYQVPGMPSGQNRLYAGLISTLPNMGASGYINQFHGDVENGTFSLIEVAVVCPWGPNDQRPKEQIGVVVSRDKAGFRDSQPRLHFEFLTQGDVQLGHRKGGWDEKITGFVPQRGRPYGPNVVVLASAHWAQCATGKPS